MLVENQTWNLTQAIAWELTQAPGADDFEKIEQVRLKVVKEIATKIEQAFLGSLEKTPNILQKAVVMARWFILQKELGRELREQMAIATENALLHKTSLDDWMPDSESPLSDAVAEMVRRAIAS